MKLCNFGDGSLGLVRDDTVIDVTRALDDLGTYRYPLPAHDLLIANLDAMRKSIEDVARSAPAYPLHSVKLRSPIANAGKVVAAPVNYQKHFDEATADPATFAKAQVRKIHESGLFLKASSSLAGPSEGIAIRFPDRRTDHEVELAVIIGKVADRVPASRAMDHVAAYSIGLDITTRGQEERSLRKSSDTYSILGPWIVTADDVEDPGTLALELSVNGERRQFANTRDLILSIPELIEFASKFYTLHPGDVLMTGTPEGVGPIKSGDTINAWIEQIGSMKVAVR
jgi:2-keto-4-pentenoate hydratase/2-oxohepta-3-ene-1,7-dioic acid hydratase in catechol pathway